MEPQTNHFSSFGFSSFIGQSARWNNLFFLNFSHSGILSVSDDTLNSKKSQLLVLIQIDDFILSFKSLVIICSKLMHPSHF